MARKFDLNMDDVLEAWEVKDGIREVIANALDEQVLTGSAEVEIYEEGGCWHVRDYGRGLKPDHLKQDEDDEKLEHPDEVIGKFGVGLKDALATFYRNGVGVEIRSPHCDVTLQKSGKHGFEDIETLHAVIEESSDPGMQGTDVILDGCDEEDVERAKNAFLRYSGDEVIEETKFGQVLEKEGETARIYISGLRVAEEENFLFSYNITNTTKKIRDAMNRERSNVGRTAYSSRVKRILQECESGDVAQRLVEDLQDFNEGSMHDELTWKPVAVHACKILNASKPAVFFSPMEVQSNPMMVDRARGDGKEIITVPENIRQALSGAEDIEGNPLSELDQFATEWNESFDFDFIDSDEMSESERRIFEQRDEIMELIGGRPKIVEDILVSETMRLQEQGDTIREVQGLWEGGKGRIIVKRSALESFESFAGTLLHEAAHATSGAVDVSREFESELTNYIGRLAGTALDS